MKKLAACLFSLLLLMGLSAESLYLRMSLVQGIEHPHAKAAEYFSRIVSRSTDGEINIKLYPSAALGDSQRALEQLRFGGIQFALLDLEQITDDIPGLLQLIESMDLSDRDTAVSSFNARLDEVRSLLEENDLTLLTVFRPKLRCFYSVDKVFPSFDAFNGLTIGTEGSNWLRQKLRQRGILTVSVETKDMITALNNLNIAAAGEAFLDFCLSTRYQFAEAVTVSGYALLPTLLLVNSKIFHQLQEEDQKVIQDAAQRACFYADTLLRRQEASWLKRTQEEKEYGELL